MTRKKPRPFRADKAVKAVARDVIGAPRPTRLVPDKRKTTEQKRKPTLSELLQEN